MSILSPPGNSLLKPPAPSMPVKPQDDQRDVADSAVTRNRIYGDVLSAAQNLEPISNRRHTLSLRDVDYDKADGEFSLQKQKEAILGGKTLNRKIRGTWQLTDNATGELLDEREAVVAHVPYFTGRGTMINNGNEYTLSNQIRLRPGIFTRRKDNGEIEAHANILPGDGVAHRYFLDPAKGVFKFRMGQANIPLMPVLRSLGATDKQLREAWGPELVQANAQHDNPATLNKVYQKLVRRPEVDADNMTKQQAIAAALTAMKMDGEVNLKTLGQAYDKVDLDAILATTKKLLAVSRNEQEVDDRDHLAYQTFFGPEDLLSERIRKDYGGLRREVLRRASIAGNLKGVQSGALSKQLQAALLNSGLGQSLEEINPSDIFDKQTKVSRLGEGGIPSIDAVPDEARSVQPSHFGFIDPVRTPESFKAGVDAYVSYKLKKGRDGRIYAPFIDRKTGKQVYKSPQDLADATIAFPKEMNRQARRVGAMRGGKLGFYPKEEVDYILPHMENAFSGLGAMVPGKSAVKAQRMAMASRMFTQALPLQGAEAPLVQSGMPDDDRSFEELYGERMGAIRAKQGGTVVGADDSSIKVKYDDGTKDTIELYNNFPFNRKTFTHNTAAVRPGDTFGVGDLLARSNYTDEGGTTALGKNLSVAYIPFRGLNFEDAVVISEGAAKKLSSEHMYQKNLEVTDDYKTTKRDYVSMFGSKYGKDLLGRFDDDGVIKPGTEVNHGDPIILAAKRNELAKNKVHRKKQPTYSDASITWDHHSPGVITDVFKGPKGPTVLVKSISEMKVGDKISGRYGDKGVISDIIPDDEMPQNGEGKPYEVLLSPLGIISRTNPAQVAEAVLGAVAKKTGKPYKIKDFEDIEDLTQYAIEEARKHGIKSTNMVTDPATMKGIQSILSGNRFFMKLHHTAESKGQGRGTGGYTAEGTPAKGGPEGSKLVSLLDNNALLSHGATGVLRDAGAIRGQRNEAFWLPFMQGVTPPKPKVPMVYEKFVNQLKGSGINVIEDGTQTHIMALTDKDIDELAGNRFLESGETVKFEKGLEPIKGGLFDEKLTGGHSGTRWSAIKLPEPMPNPVMEEPIRRLLGLTQKKFRDVLAGKEDLGSLGSGPNAVVTALQKINVDKAIDNAREQIKSGRKTKRDEAVRRLGYLKSAKKLGIHPKDWVVNKVPVLPPKFRPVSTMSDKKLPLVADANYMYKELLEATGNLDEMKGVVDDVAEERLAVYDSFKAVTGLGDPVHPKLREKKVKGILKHVFGSSPKLGTLQRRLLSSKVDVVGRAVITPDPELDMDHVGLPEDRAWDIYRNFVARRLKRRGMPLTQALKQIEERSGLAREELVKEMSERPVIINRAPVLHKFGMLAMYPRLTKGNTLQISPLVVGGFNADFDGDAMQYHVPVDDKAVKEARDILLPSRALFSPADFKSPVHKPSQDYTGGLYAATHGPSEKRTRTFRSKRDMVAAYRRGEIDIDDPVEILT